MIFCNILKLNRKIEANLMILKEKALTCTYASITKHAWANHDIHVENPAQHY